MADPAVVFSSWLRSQKPKQKAEHDKRMDERKRKRELEREIDKQILETAYRYNYAPEVSQAERVLLKGRSESLPPDEEYLEYMKLLKDVLEAVPPPPKKTRGKGKRTHMFEPDPQPLKRSREEEQSLENTQKPSVDVDVPSGRFRPGFGYPNPMLPLPAGPSPDTQAGSYFLPGGAAAFRPTDALNAHAEQRQQMMRSRLALDALEATRQWMTTGDSLVELNQLQGAMHNSIQSGWSLDNGLPMGANHALDMAKRRHPELPQMAQLTQVLGDYPGQSKYRPSK
jgi:hypothetical protein